MSRLRRWVSSDPEEDAVLAQIELPQGVVAGASILAMAIAVSSIIVSLVIADGNDLLNVGLPLVTVLPFVLGLFGLEPSVLARERLLMASLVLGPNALLTLVAWLDWPVRVTGLGFGTQFVLYLVMMAMAYFAFAPRREMVLMVAASYVVYLTRGLALDNGYQILVWLVALSFAAFATLGIRAGAVAIARAQHALATQAAADDRRRIARDVHDVVAHTLAVSMLHVTAARMAVLRSSPDEAVEALEEAERSGRASLADVRRIVRLLRSDSDGDGAVDAAQPNLSDIPVLVEGYRSAGFEVGMTVAGSTERVSAGVGLAIYRVAQEALANAARHGDGAAAVDLRVDDGEVRLSVHNAASAAKVNARGGGLVGMEERVSAVGGDIDIEKSNGTWVVRARIPLAAELEVGGGA
jgi:signal transduction histidine kinase